MRTTKRFFSVFLVSTLCFTMLSGCAGSSDERTASRGNDMSFESLLQPMQKNSIRIVIDENSATEAPIGASKIGGKPDLPADFTWFYFQGESYEGITENRPLSFLAQINCEEVHSYDADSMLPPNGMLYFFYELATMTWGSSPEDKDSARVYYFPGDTAALQRTELPAELLEEYIIPEMQLTFSSESELPDFEEFIEHHSGFAYTQWDEYDNVRYQIVPEANTESITKLLGYANLIQAGMLLDCELTASGINIGTPDAFSNASAQQKENARSWLLLFQLDSIQTDTYELLWGDVGRIYFYIHADALKDLDFDRSQLILQCY